MVEYDRTEQNRLTEEYRKAILKAFEIYQQNIEEIYSYGCREEQLKETFLDECKTVLHSELCPKCHTNPRGQTKSGWCTECLDSFAATGTTYEDPAY